jgi:hypothetical protein
MPCQAEGSKSTCSRACLGPVERPGVVAALDEIPKPVVVALLTAPRGRHGDDHPPFVYVAQLLSRTLRAVRRRETIRGSETTPAGRRRMSVEVARSSVESILRSKTDREPRR